MKNSPFKFIINFLLLTTFVFTSAQFAHAQKMDGVEKGRAKAMLKNIKNAIKDNYYDSNFSGMDFDARFDAAEEKLKNAETTRSGFQHYRSGGC